MHRSSRLLAIVATSIAICSAPQVRATETPNSEAASELTAIAEPIVGVLQADPARWSKLGVIDTRSWGTVLIIVASVLTIWSMVYYLQRALPEIRAKAR